MYGRVMQTMISSLIIMICCMSVLHMVTRDSCVLPLRITGLLSHVSTGTIHLQMELTRSALIRMETELYPVPTRLQSVLIMDCHIHFEKVTLQFKRAA